MVDRLLNLSLLERWLLTKDDLIEYNLVNIILEYSMIHRVNLKIRSIDIIELLGHFLLEPNLNLYFETISILWNNNILYYLLQNKTGETERRRFINLLIMCSIIVYSCKKGNSFDLYETRDVFNSVLQDIINTGMHDIPNIQISKKAITDCNAEEIVNMIGYSCNLNKLDIDIILSRDI